MQLVYLKEVRLSHTPSGPQVSELIPTFVNLAKAIVLKEIDLGDTSVTEIRFEDGYNLHVRESFAEIYHLLREGKS